MSNYTAGSLAINIIGNSEKAVTSITQTIKALNSLSRAIKKMENVHFAIAGQKLEMLFEKLAKATRSIKTENITALASTAKSLGSLSKIASLEKVDFDKVGKGFENLTVAITPFVEKVQSAETSLTSLYGILSKSSGKKIQGLLGEETSPSTTKKGGVGILNVARWGAVLYTAKRIGRVVSEIAQSGADYTETLNLWETSMGKNLGVATEFVNKMNDAYGISEKTLMNAQAIFKNMIGSLGQISDTMAYQLSEGITQMAVDYASLYNQTFEQAFSKFQAVLAGQVRPIRSVAGYDITETTLFQLYQSLGGEKSMRQLTRTEKQLLSILAIFEQMDRSGAIGDLEKTMESYANQSRVMAEAWQQVVSYAGTLLIYLIKQSGLFTYINAFLIFLGDTLKAVAENLNAIEHFGGDAFDTLTEGALGAIEETDKLQGKLLDFDKFRALNESETDMGIGLDEKLINAFTNLDTILGKASMDAKELAKNLKTASGLFDEDGTFNVGNWDELIQRLKWVGVLVIGLISLSLTSKLVGLGDAIYTHAIAPLIKLGKVLVVNLIHGLKTTIPQIISFAKTLKTSNVAIGTMSAMLGFLVGDLLLSGLGDEARKVVAPIMMAVGALTALTTALLAYYGVLTWGTALPAIMGGVGVAVAGMKSMLKIENYANGGMPDKGTVFRAGEAGAEIVYNTPSGQSGVANVQQIAQATYNGTIKALNDWWGGSRAKGDIPQLERANPTGMYQAVTSVAKSNGKDWNKII